MTDPAEPVRYAFEFPDEAGYPDGTGVLSQDQKALIDEVVDGDRTSDFEFAIVKGEQPGIYDAIAGDREIGGLTYTLAGDRIALAPMNSQNPLNGTADGTTSSSEGHALVATFETTRAAIIADADHKWAGDFGYLPLYAVGPRARIVVIGQTPGRKAQESGIAWNDASGSKLFDRLGVFETEFRDPDLFALCTRYYILSPLEMH